MIKDLFSLKYNVQISSHAHALGQVDLCMLACLIKTGDNIKKPMQFEQQGKQEWKLKKHLNKFSMPHCNLK